MENRSISGECLLRTCLGISYRDMAIPASRVARARIAGAMADEIQIPLDEQLEEIGAQLDWVRGYL
jgi:hypothetical protein